MPFTLDVLPPLLSSAGLRQQMAGDRLAAIAASVESAGGDAAGAAGDPALAGALGDLGQSGAGSLRTMALSVAGLGANLGAASGAYQMADQSSMPGG